MGIAVGLAPLARALSAPSRARIQGDLRALLRFRDTLDVFPRLAAPRATPIMTAYQEGRLVGCVVGRRGKPGAEALARTFLELTSPLDGPLSLELVYPTMARRIEAPDEIELGEEGIAVVRPHDRPVILLPQIARDFGVDGKGFVALLERKAGGFPPRSRLVAWRVERLVARPNDVEHRSLEASRSQGATEVDFGAAWLARLFESDGSIAFAIDPTRRILEPRGELHLARTAVAIEALAARGGYARLVARARRAMRSDALRALAGKDVDAWPSRRAAALGSIALAVAAGVELVRELRELATDPSLLAEPWHAAQVIYALGRDAPRALLEVCQRDLARRPFAPWTALGAERAGDRPLFDAALRALAPHIRRRPPFWGGADATPVPETGLTAVAAHALALHKSTQIEANLALDFVRRRQLLPGRIPAALDPTLALGGFSATPINDVLRADIVGHAILALLAAPRGPQ